MSFCFGGCPRDSETPTISALAAMFICGFRRFGGKGGERSAECGVRSAECGVRSVEYAECRKCGVWKTRSVQNEECGKRGVWEMRSVKEKYIKR